MPHYFLSTMGCQMNRADSERVATYLRGWGFSPTPNPEAADLAVLNTCVVRQSAEDRAIALLGSLAALKRSRPKLSIALTGCLVGGEDGELRRRFPFVDLFFPPQEFSPLLEWAERSNWAPPLPDPAPPTALVSVIKGCDSFCTYCIVPYRRGRQRSRGVAEVAAEVEGLVARGAREAVLLGQSVNSYGQDLPGRPTLAHLLTQLNAIDGLRRLRFLTSHPRDITPDFLRAVASLNKVCPSFSLPLQAGDDRVLGAMGRGYTAGEYRELVGQIRQAIPDAGISTDVIVGFPGESEEQFERTVSLVRELRLDTVHIAAYSPRPGTTAAQLRDDVPSPEKKRRKQRLEALQRERALENHTHLVGQRAEVLAEGRSPSGKWQGRTLSGRLVFFPAPGDLAGREVMVHIESATPWWLEGTVEGVKE